MATVDRALGVLRLFAGEQSEWTVEAAARELGLSQSTAYQYFRSLVDGGLLSTYKTGLYVVGPAIIELDRQTRLRDPLILAGREEMNRLAASLAGDDDVVLLCRLYKLTVMCIDQRAPAAPRQVVSYERGRPMPLERGAASKVILAHLPPRVLRRYYDQTHTRGTNPTWAEFRQPLRAIRRTSLCITHGELDEGRVGLSAPVFAGEGEVIGSIGLVLSESSFDGGEVSREVQEQVVEAGQRVSAALRESG
ncbi:IclR family transcriptional regulator C-terminal domain-containing protein [Sphingomonas sp. AOB5]|uniref:IclR family transcriptional regulator n=1 Tax=Sphingomonas sp. AOB5 TaxID=3034017 RepID=UPI0023F90C94|nr:IclR family transcriptional regulator C-terminal domain-containing protein [Sphingomonas sp. AOB5]MDF7776457.1 IclR family transcriptional regulator C-terminal domain-containing protein [Sphingomonas sp. AOB5]